MRASRLGGSLEPSAIKVPDIGSFRSEWVVSVMGIFVRIIGYFAMETARDFPDSWGL